jgi:predicted RecA/RadA family phage recombinase
MDNFVQAGNALTLTAPGGGVVSGTAYLIGSLLVVATVDADAGDSFVGQVTGVISYEKPGSQAWTEGAKIYWDNSAKKMTTTSGGNTLVGVAAEAVGAGASETTGKVRLDGVAR